MVTGVQILGCDPELLLHSTIGLNSAVVLLRRRLSGGHSEMLYSGFERSCFG